MEAKVFSRCDPVETFAMLIDESEQSDVVIGPMHDYSSWNLLLHVLRSSPVVEKTMLVIIA